MLNSKEMKISLSLDQSMNKIIVEHILHGILFNHCFGVHDAKQNKAVKEGQVPHCLTQM